MNHYVPPTLKIAGDGAHLIVIKLAPVNPIRHSRMNCFGEAVRIAAGLADTIQVNGSTWAQLREQYPLR